MNHRQTAKPTVSASEEESLQTFVSSPCNNSYIGRIYGHHCTHLGLAVSTESSSSKGTSWDLEQEFICSFTCKEYMLKKGECSPFLFQFK